MNRDFFFFSKYRVISVSLNNEIASELLVKVEDIGCIKPEKVRRSFEVEFSLARWVESKLDRLKSWWNSKERNFSSFMFLFRVYTSDRIIVSL